MRALTFAPLFATFVVFAGGCVNEDPIPAFVSVAYQIRCLGDCFNATDNSPHSFYYVDGEEDLSVQCVVSTVSGKEVLTFGTYCPGGDSACGSSRLRFEISGIDINSKDGDPGKTCQVTVREGSNEYESSCTSGPIQGDRHCQISYKIDKEASLVTGSLRCEDIENVSSPDITRYIVAPNSQKAIKFTAQGCKGL